MSFLTALSGLNAAQTDISVTSNNIANVGTIGFHGSRAEFGDIYSTSLFADPRTQIGTGVRLNRTAQDFGQGSLEITSNSLDLALNGPGFFQLHTAADTGERSYSRAGAFMIDADGFVVNASAGRLGVFPTATDGTVLSEIETQALYIPPSQGEAEATTSVTMPTRFPVGAEGQGSQGAVPAAIAFDAADPESYAFSSPVSMLDENGQSRNAMAYYVMTHAPDVGDPSTRYEVQLVVDGQTAVPGAGTEIAFDENAFQTAGTAPMAFTLPSGPISLDFSGSELGESRFGVMSMNQNGEVAQGLTSVELSDDGVVWGNYGDAERIALGKIVVANFQNMQGLRRLGNASYIATGNSGEPILGTPGKDGFGDLRSGALEQANVDLTSELVSLITAQRNYQASAKALETASQMSQTVMNMRS